MTTELVIDGMKGSAGRLDLGRGKVLGSVARIDSRRVYVDVVDRTAISVVTVSNLVALPVGEEYLIGLVDAVTRTQALALKERPNPSEDIPGPIGELQIVPLGSFRGADDTHASSFRRGASAYPSIDAPCHLIEGDRFRQFMAILAEDVPLRQRLVLGRYAVDREAVAVADGNRFFQRHVALLGATGTGKSWTVAQMLERASQLSHANLIVFDLHREYGPLTAGGDGHEPIAQGLRVAGPADLGRADETVLHLPYWLLDRDELLTLVVNPADAHASDQSLRLTDHVQRLKWASLREAGREDAVATSTVDSPIPYRLDHLIDLLRRDDTERVPEHPSGRLTPGPFAGRLTGLISRLEARLSDPRLAFIFNPPQHTLSYEWLVGTATTLLGAERGATGIKIIDLSEVPSAILPVVAGVLGRLVYDVQFWMDPAERTPVCLVCDEAHLYLPVREDVGPAHHAALRTFEAIAKEGRKYGVALMIISQRPNDVSRAVLSQCNNFIIMRVTSDLDRAMIERLMPETLSGVMDVLPSLDVGEAVLIGDALVLPTRVRLDAPVIKPASATQPYWSMWSEQASSRECIAASVEALRSQIRAAD